MTTFSLCSWRARLLALALSLLAAAPALAQLCQPFWADAGSGLPALPRTMAFYDDGNGPAVYVAGSPVSQGREHVYKWTGLAWIDVSQTLPPDPPFRVIDLKTLDDGSGAALYALVWTQLNGNYAFYARRWHGSEWLPATPGLVPVDGSAWPLMSGDLGEGSRIYGYLRNPPPNALNYRLAVWNATDWTAISTPRSAPLSLRLIVFDDGAGPRLYALGGFNTLSGVQVNGFARWLGGTAWGRPPSNHTSIDIRDVASFDDGSGPALWAYGYIYVNHEELPGVAKWDGQTWVGMGGPSGGPGTVWTRSKIEVFDDGSGPALYVTGGFGDWAGIPARAIVRWNGQAWSAVGDGIRYGADVNDMVVGQGPFGSTLFIGGGLDLAGGGTVHSVAQYIACPNCYANCDLSAGSPALNVGDFVCFLQKFAARDPYANCTVDAAINVNDFVCFMQKFAAGCP